MARALIVDDAEENLYYLAALLKSNGYDVDTARNGKEALALARANPPALIVSDILMPEMDGFSLCRHWRSDELLAGVPFVFYTATYTDDQDAKLALDLGADLFLLKPLEPDALLQSIQKLIEQPATGARPQSEQPEIVLQEYNGALVRKLESKVSELESSKRQLQRTADFLQSMMDSLLLQVVALSAEGQVVAANEPANLTGSPTPQWMRQLRIGSDFIAACREALEDDETFFAEVAKLLRGDIPALTREVVSGRHVGARRYSMRGRPLKEGIERALLTIADITEVRQAEEQQALSERQLQQALKLETVGRLAGGVAHDFNNLLTILDGYGGILLARLGPDDPSRPMIEEMKRASEAASELTRKLTAFSQQTILDPRVLDLSEVVAGLERSIRALLGGKVRLKTQLGRDVGRVRADRGTLEQAIIHIAANSCDAMPQGGELSIVTQESSRGEHRYASLSLSDTGHGMDENVRARIFEPFFSTKPQSQGTGLGMAMVFGFVKQSGGEIEVDSQTGCGTTIRIYLPVVESEEVDSSAKPPAAAESRRGGGKETILLVEDEDSVRKFTKLILAGSGYQVLEASDGAAAIAMAREYAGAIDLLITDGLMPGASGAEVAATLQPLFPRMGVLFLSGFTDDPAIREGVLKARAAFLQKPFSPENLLRKVRETFKT